MQAKDTPSAPGSLTRTASTEVRRAQASAPGSGAGRGGGFEDTAPTAPDPAAMAERASRSPAAARQPKTLSQMHDEMVAAKKKAKAERYREEAHQVGALDEMDGLVKMAGERGVAFTERRSGGRRFGARACLRWIMYACQLMWPQVGTAVTGSSPWMGRWNRTQPKGAVL